MPAAVPLVAAAAGAAASGAGLATAAFGLLPWSVAAGVVNAGIGFVVSTAVNQIGSRALAKKPKAQAFAAEASGRTVSIRSSVESHKVIYGTARVSGPLVFAHTTDTGHSHAVTGDNKFLHLVIPLAGHEVEEITTVYLNDRPVTIEANGFVSSSPYYFGTPAASYVFIQKHLGAADQEADPYMLMDLPGVWTADHRLRGIAYLYVRLEYHQDIFPLGIPNISAVVKGKKVYDPRTGLTQWSDNAALCIRDYLSSDYGFACSSPEINDTYTTAAANICEEAVTLSTGGTQDRYTCNGVLDMASAPLDNLGSLVTSLAGAVTYVQGAFRIHAAAYDSPAGDIGTDILAGPVKADARVSRKDLFNAVKGTYVDPDRSWQPTDFPPVTNDTYETQDNGERIYRDIELPFTTHPEAAQRIGKLILEKARQGIRVTMPVFHDALKYAAWDVVTLTNSQMGWSAKPFRILRWNLAVPGPITLSLQEESSASYDWSYSEATQVDSAPDTSLPDPFTVLPPGSPAAEEELYVTTDGAGVKSKAAVTWGASTDVFVKEYQLEYKLTSESSYTVAGRAAGTAMEVFDIAPGLYDFRVKAISHLGVSSEYASNTALFNGLTAPPSDIGGFSLNAINNNAHLSWNPVPDVDVKVGGSIRVRYSPNLTGANWSTAVDIGPALPGISTNATLPLLSGTYMLKAVDSSGNESINPATIVSTVADIFGMNAVATSTQQSSYAGTKTNMVVVGSDLFDSAEDFDAATDFDDITGDAVLRLDSADLFDSGEYFDSDEYFDAGSAGFATEGEYQFASPVDIGKVATCRVTALIEAAVYDGIGTFDSDDEFDGPGLFDGDDESAVSAALYVRTTSDDPSSSPTWSGWRQLFVGDYVCRGLDFKLVVNSRNGAYNIDILRLSVTVDVPDVIDAGSLTTSAAGLTTVTYARTFVTTPKIGTTLNDGATGDFIVVSGQSATGFQVGVKDSGGSFIAKSVDWISRGY